MQASNFGSIFDQLFLWNFLWNFHRRCLSRLLLYHGAKKSKMTENPNQGGSCLKARPPPPPPPRERRKIKLREKSAHSLDGIRTSTFGTCAHRASDYTTRAGTPCVSRNKHFRHSPTSSIVKHKHALRNTPTPMCVCVCLCVCVCVCHNERKCQTNGKHDKRHRRYFK